MAMWIRGIPFTAALFALMTLAFAIVSGAVYLLGRRADRGSRASRPHYATMRSALMIGLISSASMAVLAGIFALPLLFNGGWQSLHREWRPPAILGSAAEAKISRNCS